MPCTTFSQRADETDQNMSQYMSEWEITHTGRNKNMSEQEIINAYKNMLHQFLQHLFIWTENRQQTIFVCSKLPKMTPAHMQCGAECVERPTIKATQRQGEKRSAVVDYISRQAESIHPSKCSIHSKQISVLAGKPTILWQWSTEAVAL